jgi:hypothetical protein
VDDGFELIGASGQIIDLAQLESKVTSPRWAVRYPAGQAFEAFDDNIGKQFFRTTAGEFIGGTLINVALSSLEFAAPWRNPYLSNEQRAIQNIVTVSGAAVLVGSLAGASIPSTGIT